MTPRQGSAGRRGLWGPALRLGTALGISVEVDATLLIAFALIAFNLAGGLLPLWHPAWSAPLCWGVAAIAALLFFASIWAHEMAHALTGRALGIRVRKITLFLFGGLAHMENQPPSAKAEFWMALMGPVASFVIGLTCLVAGTGLAREAFEVAVAAEDARAVEQALASVSPGATLLLWLGPINLMLGAFNLAPGYPLDGGRVLRALLWKLTGDFSKATRWAGRAGQGVGVGLMALGALELAHGSLVSGVWSLLIGWFLFAMASGSYRREVASARQRASDEHPPGPARPAPPRSWRSEPASR